MNRILCSSFLIVVLAVAGFPCFGQETSSGVVILPKGQTLSQKYSGDQRVLVILHGIRNTGEDMTARAKAAYETGEFDRVIAPSYDWENNTVPNVAPRLFAELNSIFPNAKFELDGYSKGGLVARWIAERVPEADGRIERVITTSSPLDGANPYGLQKQAGKLARNKTLTGLNLGLAELTSESNTIRTLKQPPVNDMRAVDYVQVWAKGDEVVPKSSGLLKASNDYGNVRQLILNMTAVPDPENKRFLAATHSGANSYIAKHPKLYRRILTGDLPPEASKQAIEIADGIVAKASQVPPGWVQCQCPGEHQGIGIWVEKSYWHDPAFFCP